jgi:hypothetical protein
MHFQLAFGPLVNGAVHVSMDRYLNVYLGVSVGIGRGAPVASALTFGRSPGNRTQAETRAMLTGLSFSGGGGFGPGLMGVKTPGVGSVTEYGLFTPQIAAGPSWGWILSSGGSICQ